MEQDKQLKQILFNSAEDASAHFTNNVLDRIHELSKVRLYDQPLVPPHWQRLFLWSFGVVVMAILGLGLFIASPPVDVSGFIKKVELIETGWDKILVFIGCFWVVFGANALLNKKFIPARKS